MAEKPIEEVTKFMSSGGEWMCQRAFEKNCNPEPNVS